MEREREREMGRGLGGCESNYIYRGGMAVSKYFSIAFITGAERTQRDEYDKRDLINLTKETYKYDKRDLTNLTKETYKYDKRDLTNLTKETCQGASRARTKMSPDENPPPLQSTPSSSAPDMFLWTNRAKKQIGKKIDVYFSQRPRKKK